MGFSGLPINPGTLFEDIHSLAVVTLIGSHKLDTAVAMLVVIPVHKIFNPRAALLFAGEWLARIIKPVFNGAEQRL